MAEDADRFVGFMKRVGVVCGAMLAAGALMTALGSFAWRTAMQPTVQLVSDERAARQYADSLIIIKLAVLVDDTQDIKAALRLPQGSWRRDRILSDELADQPAPDRPR